MAKSMAGRNGPESARLALASGGVAPLLRERSRPAELERRLALALEQVRVLTARVAELERRLGDKGGGKTPAAGRCCRGSSRAN